MASSAALGGGGGGVGDLDPARDDKLTRAAI